MSIRAWKQQYDYETPGIESEATFNVGQSHPAPQRREIGTTISLTAPSYTNNFDNEDGYRRTNFDFSDTRKTPETLFDYKPGKVGHMYTDARAPHTAGVAMGLAAQWHRTMGAERNVAHGMPTYDSSLSSDSAPIAKRLATRGMVPVNPDNASANVTNRLGRSDGYFGQTHEVFQERGDVPVSAQELRGARETLREVFGRKRTAPIQTHPQKSNGEQLRLL